jgi:glycerol dehydrogenase
VQLERKDAQQSIIDVQCDEVALFFARLLSQRPRGRILMTAAVRIFGSPSRYYQGPGALDLLPQICARVGGKPSIVIDADVFALITDRLGRLMAELPHSILPFRGEVTVREMEILSSAALDADACLIVGIGGGKALDAAKGVALRCAARFISVPTVASNDGPIGMALAVYDDEHRISAIEAMPRSPDAVIVDTQLIAGAPAQFLRAGIGDALAKKFEAEASLRDGGLSAHFAPQLRTGLFIADGCYRTIREHGIAAVKAAGSGVPDAAFEAVVEANILMAGLGFENGGLGLAHGLTRGLVRTPVVDRAPHGFHVAYGLLVQLAVEGRDEEFIADLEAFYRAIGLPLSLADLGLAMPRHADIAAIAAFTTAAPKGAYLVVSASTDQIIAGIEQVERRAA